MSEAFDEAFSSEGGHYKGISLKRLEKTFGELADEPNYRSVSAILRMTHEQLEARGDFTSVRWLIVGSAVASVTSLSAYPMLDPKLPAAFRYAFFFPPALFAMALILVVTSRHRARRSREENPIVRRLAAEALQRIATNEAYKPKPLDNEQTALLRSIVKKTGIAVEL